MHQDKKVGWILEIFGLSLLMITSVFNLPLFFGAFGFGCLLVGFVKIANRLFIEKKSTTN